MPSLTCFVGDDAYEIHYTPGSGVDSIILYRRGLDGRGEEVDYDTLPYLVQTTIYKKLKTALRTDEPDRP